MGVTLRRLDADSDEALIREAIGWIDEQPQFYRDANAAFDRGETAEDYLELMRREPQADFGVFDRGEMVAHALVHAARAGRPNCLSATSRS